MTRRGFDPKARRAASLLLLAVAGVLAWLAWDGIGTRPEGLATDAPPAADSRPAATRADSRTHSGPERVAVATSQPGSPRAAEAFGALLVRVTWAQDKTPAAEITVSVTERDRPNARAFALEAVTDTEGIARFARVRVGDAVASLDRQAAGRVKIESGKEAELALEVKPGVDAHGVVVDAAGAPVPHAELWLLDFSGIGSLAARADREGTFLVRAVAWAQFIGARAPGYAPSATQQLQATEGGRVELRLVLPARGGELTGSVLDPEGRPVAGARVYVGDARFLRAANVASRSPLALARSDDRGAFRAVGLAPGQSGVAVRAEGYAVWRGSAEVFADTTSRIEARLVRGASVVGTVSTHERRPVAAAEVSVGGSYGRFGSATRTAADGAFRLEHVEPGELEVRIDADKVGNAAQKLVAVDGEELRLDFVFPPPLSLRGRVVDEAGQPLEKWWISLEAQDIGAGPLHAGATTAADGRFVVENVPERRHRLKLHAPKSTSPSLLLEDVAPSQGELLLRVPSDRFPSVRIVGTVADAAGKPIPGTMLSPYESVGGGGAVLKPRDDTGRFELGPYPSGEWSLSVMAPNHARFTLGPRQLMPNETWDLGVVTVQRPGTFALELQRGERVAADSVVTVSALCRGRGVQCEVERKGDVMTSGPLNPDEYVLRIGGPAVASQLVPIKIETGECTRLGVPVEAGLARKVRVTEAEPDAKLKTIALVVRASDGRAVHEATLWRRKGEPFEATLALALGSYDVAVTAPGGRRSAGKLIVEAAGPETLLLTLR